MTCAQGINVSEYLIIYIILQHIPRLYSSYCCHIVLIIMQSKTTHFKNNDLIFQNISWHAEDIEFVDEDNDNEDSHDVCDSSVLKYNIKMFGKTLDGQSVGVTVEGFQPYFYIKGDVSWTSGTMRAFKERLLETMSKKNRCQLVNVELVKQKDFWGFSNNQKFNFVKVVFHDLRTMRITAKTFSSRKFRFNGRDYSFKVYESNIDPFIRFIHMNNLEPCGWIKLKRGTYRSVDGVLESTCEIDVTTKWQNVLKYECDQTAPFKIMSFDIECDSSHGDFPVPAKNYKKLANQMVDLFNKVKEDYTASQIKEFLIQALKHALHLNDQDDAITTPQLVSSNVSQVVYKKQSDAIPKLTKLKGELLGIVEDIYMILTGKIVGDDDNAKESRESVVNTLTTKFDYGYKLPKLQGDHVIQIGSTIHLYGEKQCSFQHILTLGTCSPIENAVVEECSTEAELLLKWHALVHAQNPDIITGYNIFGFDMWYLYERSKELGISNSFMNMGRLLDVNIESCWKETKLSSSALGDNFLKYIDMHGRVLIDLMKVIQRDHKLDSYKLDLVANHFMGLNKHDVSPQDIFKLQKGTADDRRTIAEYCIQDCALCNHLVVKLEIVANNMGMSNVCLVPLSFIFMRGQGIKIFSLVLKQAYEDGFLIPVVKFIDNADDTEDSYEGAIVLDPKEGIYIDEPVSVMDFASLYPSSMISENISHDCIVLDPKFDNLPGVEYIDISYDIFEGSGDAKKKTGENVCRFAQLPNNEKGMIPRILTKLLTARKTTRKMITVQKIVLKTGIEYKGQYDQASSTILSECGRVHVDPDNIELIEDYYNDFQKAVLDGLQNAYKVTANSLYGQCGARTSPIYLKDIAACTTATGRKMILLVKAFLEKEYNANIIYGDTDSIFCIFPNDDPTKNGKDRIMSSIIQAKQASREFKKHIKPPHDAEYEKTFWPFILLSKKRYAGNLYEDDDQHFKQKSMGIVLKRRDNAPIVKRVYGGIIDIILNKRDILASTEFLKTEVGKLINGEVPLEDLIVTKSLRADYKDPDRIAHKVLAERMGDRDPGNKPQSSDRIPYVYIRQPSVGPLEKKTKILQGNRIEHPAFIRENNLEPDYEFYITNQIMKPVLQVYGIVAEQLTGSKGEEHYKNIYDTLVSEYHNDVRKINDKMIQIRENDVKQLLFDPLLIKLDNVKNHRMEITNWFKYKQPL